MGDVFNMTQEEKIVKKFDENDPEIAKIVKVQKKKKAVVKRAKSE